MDDYSRGLNKCIQCIVCFCNEGARFAAGDVSVGVARSRRMMFALMVLHVSCSVGRVKVRGRTRS